jgi:hypothetical protein
LGPRQRPGQPDEPKEFFHKKLIILTMID